MTKKKVRRMNNMVQKRQRTIQVDFSQTKQQECICSNKTFLPAFNLGILSSILSPTGQEMMVQRSVWTCVKCGEPLQPRKLP
jgi:hypothetical protein